MGINVGGSLAAGVLAGGSGPSSSKSAKTSHSSTTGSSGVRQTPRRGHRIIRTSSSTLRVGRGGVGAGGTGSVVLSSSRPAPYVPEDLVAQAQSVLQGRSRNLIIRELQRTNLDVNLAVNNLLSRDEEDGDDADDAQDNYVPEDLISLLDAGINADHPSVIIDADAMFSEDMFGYAAQSRAARSSGSSRRSAERERNAPGSSVTVASTEGPPTTGNAVVSATNQAGTGSLNV